MRKDEDEEESGATLGLEQKGEENIVSNVFGNSWTSIQILHMTTKIGFMLKLIYGDLKI